MQTATAFIMAGFTGTCHGDGLAGAVRWRTAGETASRASAGMNHTRAITNLFVVKCAGSLLLVPGSGKRPGTALLASLLWGVPVRECTNHGVDLISERTTGRK